MAPTQGLRYTIHHIIVHLTGQGVMHLAAFVLLLYSKSSINFQSFKNGTGTRQSLMKTNKMTKIPINVSRFQFQLVFTPQACNYILLTFCYFTIGNYRWSSILRITQLATSGSGGFQISLAP